MLVVGLGLTQGCRLGFFRPPVGGYTFERPTRPNSPEGLVPYRRGPEGALMDTDRFWHLLDSTRGQPDRAEALAKLLTAHTPDEIVRFRLGYDDLLQAAHRVDLRGAAHAIHGGCSDGGFSDFREALIELGRPVFEAAVRDPDSLADVVNPGDEMAGAEGLGNAPAMAWA